MIRTRNLRLGAVSVAAALSASVLATVTASSPALAADLPTISISTGAVIEGNDGPVSMVFPVSLSAPSAETVTVQWATSPAPTPTAGVDYVAASGTVTFPPGVTEQSVSVTVLGDRIDERGFLWGSDWLAVAFADPVGAVLGEGFARFGIGLIVDDDPAPIPLIGSALVLEGNSGTVEMVLPLALSNASESTVTVDWATGSGAEPTAGIDYEAASGTVTFAPGETQKTVTVTVYGDTFDEPGQIWGADWMTVRISNATNAALPVGPWSRIGFGLIVDDD